MRDCNTILRDIAPKIRPNFGDKNKAVDETLEEQSGIGLVCSTNYIEPSYDSRSSSSEDKDNSLPATSSSRCSRPSSTSEGEDDKDRFEENDDMEIDLIPHQEEVVKKEDQILKKRKRSCRLVPNYQETQTDEGEKDD